MYKTPQMKFLLPHEIEAYPEVSPSSSFRVLDSPIFKQHRVLPDTHLCPGETQLKCVHPGTFWHSSIQSFGSSRFHSFGCILQPFPPQLFIWGEMTTSFTKHTFSTKYVEYKT